MNGLKIDAGSTKVGFLKSTELFWEWKIRSSHSATQDTLWSPNGSEVWSKIATGTEGYSDPHVHWPVCRGTQNRYVTILVFVKEAKLRPLDDCLLSFLIIFVTHTLQITYMLPTTFWKNPRNHGIASSINKQHYSFCIRR